MTDNIIPFGSRRKSAALPVAIGKETRTGHARCMACGEEWQAVAPTGVCWLQCPACMTMRGLFKEPAHATGRFAFHCAHCGENSWSIETSLFRCLGCGATITHAAWADISVPNE